MSLIDNNNNNNNNSMIAPSIDAVELTYKQKFPTNETTITENGVTITPNGVAKNTIRFEREEDMIVMCLSTFVHDYVLLNNYQLDLFCRRELLDIS